MKDRIYDLLRQAEGGLSYRELARELLKAQNLDEAHSRRILGPLLRDNPHFVRDREGRWRAGSLAALAPQRFLRDVTFAVVDIETTGGRPPRHRITEVAAIKVRGGREVDSFHRLVNPGRYIPWSV
ncbi:MAG: PolC-type DNA polymerase III, partial [Nitrospinota bacterium]